MRCDKSEDEDRFIGIDLERIVVLPLSPRTRPVTLNNDKDISEEALAALVDRVNYERR